MFLLALQFYVNVLAAVSRTSENVCLSRLLMINLATVLLFYQVLIREEYVYRIRYAKIDTTYPVNKVILVYPLSHALNGLRKMSFNIG